MVKQEMLTVPVEEKYVPNTQKVTKDDLNQNEQPPMKQSCITCLAFLMYIEWIIMALLVAVIFVRLVYSTDRNWVVFILITLLLLFTLTPFLITANILPPERDIKNDGLTSSQKVSFYANNILIVTLLKLLKR